MQSNHELGRRPSLPAARGLQARERRRRERVHSQSRPRYSDGFPSVNRSQDRSCSYDPRAQNIIIIDATT